MAAQAVTRVIAPTALPDERQRRNSKRAPGIVVLNRQFEAMQLGDGLGDAETEPVSRRLSASLAAIEAVKNLCPFLRGNADARVAHERIGPPLGHPRPRCGPRRRRA